MKNVSFLFIYCLIAFSSLAQTRELTSDYYKEMDLSAIKTGFLLNRATALVPSIEKYNKSEVNIDERDWKNAFHLLKLAEVHTKKVLPDEQVYTLSNNEQAHNRNIPIGILNIEGELLTTQQILNNIASRKAGIAVKEDYLKQSILLAAPLQEEIYNLNVSFVLNSKLIFNNKSTNILSVQADFSDGKGLRDLSFDQPVDVTYLGTGKRFIRILVKTEQEEKSFYCNVHVVAPYLLEPDRILNVNVTAPKVMSIDPKSNGGRLSSTMGYGNRAGLYMGCDQVFDKPVIIISGFDFDGTQDFTFFSKYYKYGASSVFDQLRNNGYDLVILLFDNGRDYIQNNAQVARQLIMDVNAQHIGPSPLIVIGESMGGLIARYALADMEHNGQSHNVSHYISFDSPHRGANVPVGLQTMTEDLNDVDAINWFNLNSGQLQTTVDAGNSPAARQMLIRYKGPSPHSDFTNFQNALNSIGYPTTTQNIAIVNGSGNGTVQPPSSFTPGTQLFYNSFSSTPVNARVQAFSNVLNAANLVSAVEIWTYGFKSTDKQRGFNFNQFNYDMIPGGLVTTTEDVVRSLPTPSGIVRIFYNNVASNFSINGHCFIPTFSAIGYSGPLNSQSDFNVNVSSALSNGQTPFSKIYAQSNNSFHVYTSGVSGLWSQLFQDDILHSNPYNSNCSSNNNPPTPPTPFFDFVSLPRCYDSNNNTANLRAMVTAGTPQGGNMISRYSYSWSLVHAVYGQVYTDAGGNVQIPIYNAGNYTLTCTITDFLNSPHPSSSYSRNFTVYPCNMYGRVAADSVQAKKGDQDLYVIYPNPTNRESTIRFTLKEAQSEVSLHVFSTTGSKVIKTLINGQSLEPGTYTYPIDLEGLPAGTYNCTLRTSTKQITRHLILSK